MIKLTDSAVERIRSLKSKLNDDTKLLRLFVEPGGCSGFEYGMSFDAEKDGDTKMESNGVTLLVDAASLQYLDGCVVNFDDGLTGKGFDIFNPNATHTCGCGKSFS
ncbi:iron-sulfur cluster insertion protein ErpA [Ruficoccus amylovorans]|uniref:Iron-sulfur cluster insertion protein ErpA n=1 Tax=Ruficoccus amylovorans TaxID=1804625 RepID=A0A842HDM4_9BACT|nr:iron-sulfur cluster insertion protein ErpA [Ruficoccus amylovorans]MBC2594148.1 iron-sulfur cluster insertion protein ErpA [Ruficoccus amylovorans]